MPILQNPESGELRIVTDPSGLLAEGWREPTDEQADHAAQALDFGTVGQQAQAQGERVLRGATLGAVRGFGEDADIQARADVSEREHPILSFAADVAPQVALGAATGGLGEAAALGLGAARGGLVAGAAALAGESIAGGAVGAAQAAYERGQYLGEDPGRDAENALIFGGLNFGLGAVSHALAGAGGKGVSRLASEGEAAAVEGAERATVEDVAKVAEQEVLDRAPAALDDLGQPLAAPEAAGAAKAAEKQAQAAAVEDGLDRALNNASRGEADEIVSEAAGGKVPSPEADSFGRQRRLYQNRDAIMDVATREMRDDLNGLLTDLPAIARGGKTEDVVRNVSGELSSQRALADGIAENAAKLAGTLRGEAKAYAAESGKKGIQYAVPGSKDLVRDLTEHAQAIAQADTGNGMFEAIDAFKRTLQDHKLSFEAGALNSESSLAYDRLIPRVGTFASQVRSALEDGAVWGKAGDMQKAYNSVIHDQLMPNMKVFEESVLKRTSKNYDSLWKMEGWESKIGSLLEGGDLVKVRHVNGVLDALDALASVRSEFGDAATGSRMAERVAKIRRTMGLAEEVQDASARMVALGTVAGATPLVGGLAKEWVTGDLANAFRRLSGAVDRGIDRGVDDWIASSVVRGDAGSLLGNIALKTARAVTGAGDDSAIGAIARRQGISHALARFMGSDETPQAAFERARASLQSDEQFFQALGQDYKSLQEFSPETYMALSGNATKLRAFLLQRMPANVSVSMMRPDGHPPSRDAIEDWALLWNAARRPLAVVSNIGAARLPELQTVQAGYPRLYERTQMRVLQKIAAAQTAGKPLDDALLMRLNLLFPDIDGAGSPAFSRKVGQMARDYTAAQQQAGPASGGTARPRPSLNPSPVGGIASTGATFGTGP